MRELRVGRGLREGLTVDGLDPGAIYGRARVRVDSLLEGLTPALERRAVPACPGWDVHDLVAHVVGVVEDALAGRMDGVTTDPWTAAQVARGRERSIAELVASWRAGADLFAAALPEVPQGPLAAVDLVTHEHDLRGALVRPGARDHDDVATLAAWLAGRVATGRSDTRFELDGRPVAGPTDAPVTVRCSSWELLRAILGRRSVAQVRRLTADRVDDEWCRSLVIFGPAQRDLAEPA